MNTSDSTTWYVPGPIPVPYENGDELEHQPPFYFCNKPDCPCHTDPELLAELQKRVDEGAIMAKRALEIFWNMS